MDSDDEYRSKNKCFYQDKLVGNLDLKRKYRIIDLLNSFIAISDKEEDNILSHEVRKLIGDLKGKV